jgi:hypothetical protein
MSFRHWRHERREFTFWWHVGNRSVFSFTVCWLRSFCHLSVETRDREWKFAVAVPGLALWLTFDGFGLWHPQRTCTATWETPPRPFVIPDDRECSVSVHDWTLRLTPWGRWGEWRTADPWWIRGVSLNLLDAFLGRTKYTTDTVRSGIPLVIPMPEGVYRAVAKIERCTWKRPRWFATTRTYVGVDVPKGIPFAGKGENAWDCGDDGLFGYSSEGESLERAIAKGVESVLSSRRKHGHASPAAIAEALS